MSPPELTYPIPSQETPDLSGPQALTIAHLTDLSFVYSRLSPSPPVSPPTPAQQLDNYLLHSIGICSLTCTLNIHEPATWEMEEAPMALLRVLLA